MSAPAALASLLVALGLALACGEPKETSQRTALPDEVAPAVFRSTLDGRPRVLTIQLAPALWAAWDVEQAALFELFRDGVDLEGAVYDGLHGPQPVSRGNAWLPPGYGNPWRVLRGEREELPRIRYRGHSQDGGAVTLRYALELADGGAIEIRERPRALVGPDGGAGFERRFEVRGTPADAVVALDVSLGLQDPERDVETDMRFELRPTLLEDALGGRLFLAEWEKGQEGDERESRIVLWLRGEPRIPPPSTAGELEQPRGLTLTLQSDCAVCHGLERATVGPSFRSISGRYTDADVPALARRVIDGASGSWGPAVMTPHPDLSDADAREMVGWILSLEKPAGAVEVEPPPERGWFSGWGDFFAELGRRLSPANTPGDGIALAGVHPSFDLETIRPPGFEPRVGGLDFLPDGRLVVSSWDPNGGVYVVDGLLSDPPRPRATRIAAGLAEPLGVRVVDGEIYVLQKPELTRLVDRDGDGVVDLYETISQGWGMTTNFHEFAFGLAYRDGFFYATLATAILPGGASAKGQVEDRGSVLRIARDGGAASRIARGLRVPNGVGFGPFGLLYVTDNQGDWLPASKVVALDPLASLDPLHPLDPLDGESSGVFFGSRAVLGDAAARLPVTPPVVWLPQHEIGNSPSQPAPLDVGPYRGQLVHADVTHGGLKRVFVERIALRDERGGAAPDVMQGAVFRFSQGFEAGLNRLVWGPDGRLYVGGIGSDGNWGQAEKERFGLQRLTYSGRSTFEMLAMRAREDGFEIELTQPLANGSGEQQGDYRIEQWRYQPDAEYGGPKRDLRTLEVESVRLSPDRRTSRLVVAGLEAGHVVYLRLRKAAFESEEGDALWSTEAWYTLNALPRPRAEAEREAAR